MKQFWQWGAVLLLLLVGWRSYQARTAVSAQLSPQSYLPLIVKPENTPTPTPSPTPTMTLTPSPTPTFLPTATASPTPTMPPLPTATQTPTAEPTPSPQPGSTQPLYGVNFISSAETNNTTQQYQNGLATGAGWNRWPFYWFSIETSEGNFDWSKHDAVVISDYNNGLLIDAILLGTPGFYLTGVPEGPLRELKPIQGDLMLSSSQAATPKGLHESIFTDGSDIPGPGKVINGNNRWARYVYLAVDRYRPGGLLAQAQGWPAGAGITHWEMWNEPDLEMFWNASLDDYARLLKVGYLSAKHADPNAQILFGGLANSETLPNYFKDVMIVYDGDSMASSYDYFHDVTAIHSYSNSWKSWLHVYRTGNVLKARGLDKPIWLNEHGVPAWDDYPGPVWDPGSSWRSTMDEQADYMIQSAFYAIYAGVDGIFHFQLYDGCGNQPQSTDFPPHNGELCDGNGNYIHNPSIPCVGDAYGLFRNPSTVSCFTQHPQPETPRPQFAAVQVLSQYVHDVVPLWRSRPGSADPYNGPQEWIALERNGTYERVLAVWSRFGTAETAVIPAAHSEALLIRVDGSTEIIYPTNNMYTLTLPAASNQNYLDPPSETYYLIGGRPIILIEPDTRPPLASISVITATSNGITLTWSADDFKGMGIQDYDLQYSENGGAFTAWLSQTTATTAVYPAVAGNSYYFAVTARDRAGNVSEAAVVGVSAPANNPMWRRQWLQ